jgi:hypothetical protein
MVHLDALDGCDFRETRQGFAPSCRVPIRPDGAGYAAERAVDELADEEPRRIDRHYGIDANAIVAAAAALTPGRRSGTSRRCRNHFRLRQIRAPLQI